MRHIISAIAIVVTFYFCNNNSGISSNSATTKETSIQKFIREYANKEVDSLSNGYLKFIEIIITRGEGNLSSDGVESWYIDYIIKVKGLKDGGDIYIESANESTVEKVGFINDIEVKPDRYANAITKTGTFYKCARKIKIKEQNENWVIDKQ